MLLTREQLQERFFALHRASLELVKDVALEHLLHRIAELALEQAEAQYAALGVFGDDGVLKEFVSVGLEEERIKKIAHPPVGKGLLGELRNAHEPLRVSDISKHPKSVGFPTDHPEMMSFLGVPIRVGDQQVGQIYLTNKVNGGDFTEDDEKIIQMLAAYAFAAIQNARLHENSRRLAVLEERERIGMDLHDGIIQSIYGVGLSLENAFHIINEDTEEAKERVKGSIDGLNQVIRDLRSYILDLKPRELGDMGLMNGIKRLLSEFKTNSFAEIQLIEPDSSINDIPQSHTLALFHICQEALANIAKHAKAKKVQISIWTTEERVLMEIIDNGHGFNIESINSNIGHGLANMRTRVTSIGGDIDISSVQGDGTTLLVWIPRIN